MTPLPWLLFAHLLADYPLQGPYLAETKGANPHSLLAHAAIWTGCIVLAAQATGGAVGRADGLLLLLVHAGPGPGESPPLGPLRPYGTAGRPHAGPGPARAATAPAAGVPLSQEDAAGLWLAADDEES